MPFPFVPHSGSVFEITSEKYFKMNFKRIFGPLLTLAGIVGLIYGAYLFLNPESADWKTILVLFVLGFVFFGAGLNLLKTTKDSS